jgi:acyl-CoA hydrolase
VEPKPASQSGALLARWMGIGDANSQGNVHGGTIMKLADEAAGVAAIKHSRKRVVTGKPTEVPPVVATTPQE